MTSYRYTYSAYLTDKHARAFGRDLPISLRASVEICREIRHKPLERAKRILQDAMEMKQPIRYLRFTEGAGHKPGMRGGKYPVKACTHILRMLESAEANAHHKGLGKDLKIIHVAPQKASKAYRYGRQARRKYKRTHIEVVLAGQVKEETKPVKQPGAKNSGVKR